VLMMAYLGIRDPRTFRSAPRLDLRSLPLCYRYSRLAKGSFLAICAPVFEAAVSFIMLVRENAACLP